MTMNRKLFVLDTSVLLYDPECFLGFAEHDIGIPITVFEELDRLKLGNDSRNFAARKVIRSIDSLFTGTSATTSTLEVCLGSDKGTLMVLKDTSLPPEIRDAFVDAEGYDNRILAAALNAQYRYCEKSHNAVVLLTKDINLRIKARSLGLQNEDYRNLAIDRMDHLYTSPPYKNVQDSSVIDTLYVEQTCVLQREAVDKPEEVFIPNYSFVLMSGKQSALVRVKDAEKQIVSVVKEHKAYGITPRNMEQTFFLDCLLDPSIPLVIGTGKAGTGKTLLAVAAALEAKRQYLNIFISRAPIPVSRDIGFLPGSLEEKLDPYMAPLFDNINFIRSQYRPSESRHKQIDLLLSPPDKNTAKMKIASLDHLRGRSLSRVYFIVDEAQNLTPHDVKTLITRAGEGAKIVLVGDPDQIDTPYLDKKSNGLTHVIKNMRHNPLMAHVHLVKGERSRLSEEAATCL